MNTFILKYLSVSERADYDRLTKQQQKDYLYFRGDHQWKHSDVLTFFERPEYVKWTQLQQGNWRSFS